MARNILPFCSLIVALSAGPAVIIAQTDQPPTADNQKNNRTDMDTTARIRKAITHDKSLSTSAHNIKIITQNGSVTLRGKVDSEDEKQRVVAKAREAAGEANINDALIVASAKQ
jgi:hyperosmotically inducible protein